MSTYHTFGLTARSLDHFSLSILTFHGFMLPLLKTCISSSLDVLPSNVFPSTSNLYFSYSYYLQYVISALKSWFSISNFLEFLISSILGYDYLSFDFLLILGFKRQTISNSWKLFSLSLSISYFPP